ncbi:CD59 glycoprotein isoform X3 [Phycodurus eques]|uniref:CD59 glycoprotein isoform X3 n=1 Tax=Phycodurus eques TaxID=693459 RepID=UPI002ACE0A43|nr:CD59 glycoprotein isoform X3 [Phycodurus eques]
MGTFYGIRIRILFICQVCPKNTQGICLRSLEPLEYDNRQSIDRERFGDMKTLTKNSHWAIKGCSLSGRRGQRRLDVRVFTHPRGWRVESIGAEEEETMPRADRLPVPVPVLVLVLTMTTFVQRGGALRCYRCSDYTGRCDDVHECAYEDACLTLGVQGGKTVRQCIRYTDCDNSRLSQMFPSMSSFSYRCCNNNLCNSSGAVGVATPGPLLLIGWLLSALAPWL